MILPGQRSGRRVAGGDSQRLRQTPCVVEGAIGPRERLETRACGRDRNPLQRNILQQPIAAGSAFRTMRFEASSSALKMARSDVVGSLVASNHAPRSARPHRSRMVAASRRQRMGGASGLREVGSDDQPRGRAGRDGARYALIGSFERQRSQEIVGLLDSFDRRAVKDGLAGEPAADNVDRAAREFQDCPPGRFERDSPSRFGEDRVETADSRIGASSGDPHDEARETIEPRIEGRNSHKLENAAESRQCQHAVVIAELRTDPAGGRRDRAKRQDPEIPILTL